VTCGEKKRRQKMNSEVTEIVDAETSEVPQVPMLIDTTAVQAPTVNLDAEGSKAIQLIRDRMIMARKLPRNEQEAIAKIKRACQDPVFAAKARFKVPRKPKPVEGPSIHLARLIARTWGNFDVQTRIIDQTDTQTVVECIAWDIESNTTTTETIVVKHVRYADKKLHRLTNPDDIFLTISNRAARRLRECIKGQIPSYVFDMAEAECIRTLKTPNDLKKVVENMLAAYLEDFGVTQDQISAYLQKPIADCTASDVEEMRSIHNAIKDGETTLDKVFRRDKADVAKSV
jgi:hypothetical protein